MAEIRVGLKELWAGFQESASDENLDMPARKLAARMCVTVTHIHRVEGLVNAAAKTLSERVMATVNTRLAKFVEELGAELAGISGDATPPADAPADAPVGEPVEGEAPARPAAAGLPQTTPPAPMPRGKGRKPAPPKVEVETDPEADATIGSMLADTEAEIRAIEAQAQGKPALRTVPAPSGGNAS